MSIELVFTVCFVFFIIGMSIGYQIARNDISKSIEEVSDE